MGLAECVCVCVCVCAYANYACAALYGGDYWSRAAVRRIGQVGRRRRRRTSPRLLSVHINVYAHIAYGIVVFRGV